MRVCLTLVLLSALVAASTQQAQFLQEMLQPILRRFRQASQPSQPSPAQQRQQRGNVLPPLIVTQQQRPQVLRLQEQQLPQLAQQQQQVRLPRQQPQFAQSLLQQQQRFVPSQPDFVQQLQQQQQPQPLQQQLQRQEQLQLQQQQQPLVHPASGQPCCRSQFPDEFGSCRSRSDCALPAQPYCSAFGYCTQVTQYGTDGCAQC